MDLRVLRVSKTPLKPHPTVYGVDRPSGTEVHLSNAMLCDGLGALGGLSVSIDRCVLHDDAGGGLNIGRRELKHKGRKEPRRNHEASHFLTRALRP